MEMIVLNEKLERIYIMDFYESLIWTDRYFSCGDFELYTTMQSGLLNHIKQGRYLQIRESDHVMIIEKIQITSDIDTGNKLIVTGRSLESLLDRRIIWGQVVVNASIQSAIKGLITDNIISPSNPKRRIPNFIFQEVSDPAINAVHIRAQYTGDNLYDVIQMMCEESGIGFKIILNDSGQFVFTLYSGKDRSYNQTENPYVIFSPKFDNMLSGNYMESNSNLKNVTLIAGEGEGKDRKYVSIGNKEGLERRELFTDARDISSKKEDGAVIPQDEYIKQLSRRGIEKLLEHPSIVSFEGQIETKIMFEYGKDFFNGDIVQIANEYGHETQVRILEIVMSENSEGITVYPTFKTLTQEGV